MRKRMGLLAAAVITLMPLTGVQGNESQDQTSAQIPESSGGEQSGKVVYPKKIELDKNFDGKPDAVETFVDGKIKSREEDADFDGVTDSWTSFDEAGNPLKTERDSNRDGKPDAWVHY